MRDVSNSATSMASKLKLSSIVSTAATAAMYIGFAALGAQAVALVAALAPLIGLLALLPALGVAAGAGFGVLLVATHGLSEAMKAGAESGAAAAAAQESAERRLAAAQQTSLDAQKALNDARETAADKLRDVNLQLARSRLDERAAILAVADAQKALQAAQRSGNRDAINHAALGYAEAAQSLQEVQARLQDVTQEDAKRNAQGVEGSDEVQAALRRQADAMQSLADAQKAVKTAGGGNAAQQAYAELSAAGKQLVDSLHSIGPAWQSVQTEIQQATFAGVGGDVKALAATWFPMLKVRLSEIGAGWNAAFRGVAQLANTKGFVDDINTSLGNMAMFWRSVGLSFAPFLDGFRQFTVTGSAFLPSVGSWVLRIAHEFDHWATAARESGRAHAWIQNALVTLSLTWAVLKNLGSAIVGIFRAGSAGPDWLPGLVAGTRALSDWVNSPAGQGKLAAVFATLRDVGSEMWRALSNIGPVLADAFSAGGTATDTLNVFGVAIGFAADHIQTLAAWFPIIVAGFVAYKAAQAGAVVVEAIRLPILVAQTVSSFALASAMKANTAAILGNEIATKRNIVSMVALKTATVAQGIAARAAAVGQMLLDIAMDANPIGIIILAIVLLVGAFIYLWNHSEAFRNFWIGLWNHIWSFLKMIGAWFAGPFVDFFVNAWHWIIDAATEAALWIHGKIQSIVDFVTSLPGKITAAARGMWNGLVDALKGTINMLLSLWNKLDFGISISVPNWVPGIGGMTYSIPDIIPDLPYLAGGGIVPATPGGRLAMLGDGGEDEAVIPLSKLRQTQTLTIHLSGPEEIKRLIRKIVHDDGGGDVQVAFGR